MFDPADQITEIFGKLLSLKFASVRQKESLFLSRESKNIFKEQISKSFWTKNSNFGSGRKVDLARHSTNVVVNAGFNDVITAEIQTKRIKRSYGKCPCLPWLEDTGGMQMKLRKHKYYKPHLALLENNTQI